MRLISLLLLTCFGIGCGAGTGTPGSTPHFGSGFSPPSVSALTPNSSPANSAPFTITIDGNNFGADAVVFWNGAAQHTTFVNPTQLLVTVTSVDLMFVGITHVFVRTGGFNSNTLDFNVTPQ
jgi:IPT/TIG domain